MKYFIIKVLVVFALLIGMTTVSLALPACPSDLNKIYDNCFGTYTWPSGQKYVGEWENDTKHGQGTQTWPNGAKYVGEWQNSRHGQGTYTHPSGTKYIGEWKNDKIHGLGTFTYADGRKNVGAFENGKLNGYAITYYVDGNIYLEGIFKDNKFLYAQKRTANVSTLPACPPPIGKIGNVKITDPIKHNCSGIDKDANGNTYEGGWYFGKKHGQGTYTSSSGAKYVGEWKNDKRHGQGTMYKIDGSVSQQGIFKNDEFLHAQKKNKVVPQVELLAQIMEGKRPEWTKKQVKCFAKEMKKRLDKNLFDQFVSMMKKEKTSIDDLGIMMAVMTEGIWVAGKCGISMDLNNMLEDN